eukprot:3296786-Rhodomonas_salina.1
MSQSNCGVRRLPALKEGGVFSMIVDCDRGTVRFEVDGVGPDGPAQAAFQRVPKGQCQVPFVAFGGDT